MSRLARANTVEGWMDVAELAWLEGSSAGLGLVIEFGSWCGRSSVALTGCRRLICVDTWAGSDDEPSHAEFLSRHDIVEEFRRNLGPELVLGTVEARVGHLGSDAFCERLAAEFGGQAAMVFVDAAHDEASVRRDIALARRLLSPGGLLCGHDYSEFWPGVVAAVNDLVPQASRGPCSIWWARE